MSFRVIGYSPDGTRRIVDDGPSVARVQGHGGEALGSRFVLTAVKTTKTRMEAASRRTIPEETHRPICGALLRYLKEPCARRPGHARGRKGGGHRSVAALAYDALHRRSA